MSDKGDDIEVPLKPPSRQVRSGDATAATGGASPLFGRQGSQHQPPSQNAHGPSMTPSLMSQVPSSYNNDNNYNNNNNNSRSNNINSTTRATDIVVNANDDDANPPEALPGPSNVQLDSAYAPSAHQSSYVVDLDRVTSPTGGADGQGGDMNAVPVRLSTNNRSQSHPWHYGLCTCCKDTDSCLESYFCVSCQTSRQCNMVMNNQRGIHWPICCLSYWCGTSAYSSNIVQCFLVGQLRVMVRKRYAVSGSTISDFGLACCCSACVLQQMLLEMTVMDDFPGATCYQAVATVPPVVEMV